jgi:tetratricopeptide (TPR) repeat protein
VGLLLGSIFIRQIVFSRSDLLLGDVGDARFNGVILEHWWQVLQGTAHWLSPPFFFPVMGVLGWSDVGFLNALPYVVLRFLGIEPFTAYQIVLFVLVVVGWIGTILFLRGCLKLSILPTIIGATLFVFPNSMAVTVSLSHTQLLTVNFIPYLVIGIYVFLQNFKKPTSIGIAAGIFVAIIVPAIFYTSYYIGWFSLFFILLLSCVCAVWSMLHSGSKVLWQSIIWKRETWLKILSYCVISATCFIPFLLTYFPALKQFGSRGYQEISTHLPSFIDYVNVGPNNWLWGKTLYATFVGLDSRPMSGELVKGLPICLLLVFLAFVVYFIRKVKHYQLSLAKDDTCKIIVDGNEANDAAKLAILAAGLSITVLLAWLLILKVQGFSLWWLVTMLIPGGGGIRGVYRFQHVLAFPIAIVVAIGLHQAINFATSHIHSSVKRGACLVAIPVLCLLLVGEQFNTGSIANYSKQQQRDMLAVISPPPHQAKVFALLPAEGLKKDPCEAQVDAMIIAQKFGLNTINGYSGQRPPEWIGMYYFDKPDYIVYLHSWIKNYNLENNQLYFLDTKTGKWLSAMSLQPSLQERAILMYGPIYEINLGIALADQGKNEEAIAHYLAAIKINPNYADAYYYNLANLFVKQGKTLKAIDNYRKAIKNNPDHFNAHFNLASVLVKERRLEEAIDHFRQVVRIIPSFAALNSLGVNLERQLKHDEAIYYYRRAAQLEPKNPGIYFNLGVALGNKGELEEAIENFRQAVYLNPDYEDARQALRLAIDLEKKQMAN